MSTVIEPVHLLKLGSNLNDEEKFRAERDMALDNLALQLAATTASSDSEQVVATIAPPIQSHVVAQIPAVDHNVDAPTAPKIIDHFVLSSHIKNPG